MSLKAAGVRAIPGLALTCRAAKPRPGTGSAGSGVSGPE